MNPWAVFVDEGPTRSFPTLMACIGYCKCMQTPAIIFHHVKPVAEFAPSPEGGDLVMYV